MSECRSADEPTRGRINGNDDRLPRPDRVTAAIQHWEASTKIRFLRVITATVHHHRDHVLFTAKGGCWAAIGRQGGEQIVSLGDDGTLGNAIHEIGHTVGLWHEQSREDRSQFVTVHLGNADGELRGEDAGRLCCSAPTRSRLTSVTIVVQSRRGNEQ